MKKMETFRMGIWLGAALLSFLCLMGIAICLVLPALRRAEAAIPFKNPGTVTIEDPSIHSRVLAISDTHGMLPNALQALRDGNLIDAGERWTGGTALLIVNGDSIDKGPDSLGLLDLWIRLAEEAERAGGRVLHLLGNHEAEFLANPTASNGKAQEFLAELRAKGLTPAQIIDPSTPRGRYLRSMPVAARVGRWLFCHAGRLPEGSWAELTERAAKLLTLGEFNHPFLIGKDSLLEAKRWWLPGSPARAETLARLRAQGLEGVVFGHQPKGLGVATRAAASRDGRLIKIDHGMAPEAGGNAGGLLVFPEPSELMRELSAGRPQVFELVGGEKRALRVEAA